MPKKKHIIDLVSHKPSTDIVPENFTFKPANGSVNEEGIISVSGMNFTELEIEMAGKKFENLSNVFAQIKEEMESNTLAQSKPNKKIVRKSKKNSKSNVKPNQSRA